MTLEISSLLHESRIIAPSPSFAKASHIGSSEEYEKLYRSSVENPDKFWAEQAEINLHWFSKWNSVMSHDFQSIGTTEKPYVQFFKGGKLNISFNCLDRHLLAGKGEKKAITWQGDKEEEKRTLSYKELHFEVCRFANVLKKHGVGQNTTVTVYMPMVPEAVFAMLACARVGAVHSVVFGGFSAQSLRDRRARDLLSERRRLSRPAPRPPVCARCGRGWTGRGPCVRRGRKSSRPTPRRSRPSVRSRPRRGWESRRGCADRAPRRSGRGFWPVPAC